MRHMFGKKCGNPSRLATGPIDCSTVRRANTRSPGRRRDSSSSQIGDHSARAKKRDHAREHGVPFDELVAKGGEHMQRDQRVRQFREEMVGFNRNTVNTKLLLEWQSADERN